MIIDFLLSPVLAPINGISWIAEKILDQAEGELDEKENLGKRLLALQLAFDMGDIPEEEFEIQEEELLMAIQAMEDAEKQARLEEAQLEG